MREYMRAHAIATLFTAHTRDDQAETLLMRLARGSGLDGLAAMAPWIEAGARGRAGALRIVRPLLGVAKARLRATLEARGIPWIEDPSNQSPAFERTRWRAARGRSRGARPVERDAGLERAAAAAGARGARGRDRRLLRRGWRPGAHRPLRLLPHRPGEVAPGAGGDRRARDRPVHRGGRRIGRAGAAGQARADRRQAVAAARPASPAAGRWPGRRSRRRARSFRSSASRAGWPLPVMTVAGGAKVLWDGRFAIEIADGLEGSLEVRALGERRPRGAQAPGSAPSRARRRCSWRPRSGAETTSSPCRPSISGRATDLEGPISADFMGLRYNSGATGRIRSDDLDAC